MQEEKRKPFEPVEKPVDRPNYDRGVGDGKTSDYSEGVGDRTSHDAGVLYSPDKWDNPWDGPSDGGGSDSSDR